MDGLFLKIIFWIDSGMFFSFKTVVDEGHMFKGEFPDDLRKFDRMLMSRVFLVVNREKADFLIVQ